MSRVLVSRVLAAGFLLGAIFCGRIAFANAASVEDLLAGGLLPSTMPPLLEPITSEGRKGWDCKPEHAAEAQHWHAANLPADPARY
jgi:hypothetical protein